MLEIPYIRVIVLLHAAFAGVFYFLNRQHPSKFARYLAASWTIEAGRALIRVQMAGVPGPLSYDWFALSDLLQVPANWCLLAGCADLAGVTLPRLLGRWYFCLSLPLLVANRYLTPSLLAYTGLAPDRHVFLGVFFNQVLLFVPVALVRLAILSWLFKLWRQTRLPGALVATVFCVPYAVFAIAYPFQYYYGYNPTWVTQLWCLRVLGFSIGLVMLLLSQQLAALQLTTTRLATAQAHAKLGSWEFEWATRLTTWSAELFRLVGRDPALGPPSLAEVLLMIHPGDRATFERHYVQTLETGHGLQGQFRLVRPDGSVHWVDIQTAVVTNAAGHRVRLTGTVQDISEKKAFEEQFLRAQRMENLGLLAAGIAHDFNNILAPMRIAAPILREHMSDRDDRHLLSTVEHSAERGAALVRQILSFTRGQEGSRRLVQPDHILRELIELVQETFPRTLTLEQQIAAEPWPVLADPTQLHQVLLNLCVNARDAMPENGTLRLGLSNRTLDSVAAAAIPGGRPGPFVLLEIGDTGSGIPPEILPRIWEPFFTTKAQDKGTGLGLSTVRGLVTGHGGFCAVRTAVGAGTTFQVYLPAEMVPAAEYATPALHHG